MRNLLIIIILILIVSCKTNYIKTTNRYSQVYQFKNSKTIIFNDSITRKWFINIEKETPFSPDAKDIVALNKKLETDFFEHIKTRYIGFAKDSLDDIEYYIEQEKQTLDWAKDVQNQMKHLNKQLVSYQDSLGRKVFAIKIIQSQEEQNEIEKNWVGRMITLRYDLEKSKFFMD